MRGFKATYLLKRGSGMLKVNARLRLMARTAQNLNVRRDVFSAECKRLDMVYVNSGRKVIETADSARGEHVPLDGLTKLFAKRPGGVVARCNYRTPCVVLPKRGSRSVGHAATS
jgi:hypothetical protein